METARDIAIIVLAVESIVIGALLIYLVFLIRSLVKMLGEEIKPIVDTTRDTVGTVRGTTVFLSDTLVGPVVQVTGFFSGLRQAVRTLVGSTNNRREEAQPSREAEVSPGEHRDVTEEQ